jgi:hypothetical protein
MGTQRRWWQPRYELWVVRAEAADVPVLLRSRHRIRTLADWSRRMDGDHVRLLSDCELVIVDRDDRRPLAASVAEVTPIAIRTAVERRAA